MSSRRVVAAPPKGQDCTIDLRGFRVSACCHGSRGGRSRRGPCLFSPWRTHGHPLLDWLPLNQLAKLLLFLLFLFETHPVGSLLQHGERRLASGLLLTPLPPDASACSLPTPDKAHTNTFSSWGLGNDEGRLGSTSGTYSRGPRGRPRQSFRRRTRRFGERAPTPRLAPTASKPGDGAVQLMPNTQYQHRLQNAASTDPCHVLDT